MRKSFLFVLGICLALNNTCYAAVGNATVPGEIGRFFAQRGENGRDGSNGNTGPTGPEGCPPLISSDTKNEQGCFVVKQRSQVRNGSGTCQATGSWSTIDTVCDCRPSETRTPCGHGGSEEACGTAGRAGYKIVTTQCDGTGSTISYVYDNNCSVTVNSVNDVHQDNDVSKPVTHKQVTFKNTCTDTVLSETANIPVGQNGSNCDAGVEVTPCSPTADVKCGANGSANASRTGVRIRRKNCDGTIDDSFTAQYILHGDDGTSFNYLGTVANCNALPTIPTPSANDAYLVKGTGLGRVCIYTGSGWPTCPDDCAEFTGPAGDNNCTGLETSSTAVKNTTLTYSGPTKSDTGLAYYTTKGKMTTSHTPCNPSVTLDDSVQDDACTLITAPSGSTCTGSKKAYYECTTQAAVTGLAKGATYNLCISTAGDSIADALSGKEDTLCVGNNAQSSSVERKKTVTYTAPSGSGSYDGYSWNTVVGKVVNKSVKCDGTEVTLSSIPDKCVELEKPTGVCTASTKVYYQCTRSDNSNSYNLCATGNSILSAAQTVAETAAAGVDPCAELPAGATNDQKKAKVKSMSRAYTLETPSAGNDRTTIGYTTVTKTTCATGADSTLVEYQYDTCKEIVDTRTTGACSGNDKIYLECTNTTKGPSDNGRTYNVCQTVTANTSLANKVDGKIDANYLSTNGYLTSNSSLSAAKLTGTIDSGRLPSNVVTTGNDATHGFDTLLGNSVSTAVSTAISTEIGNGSEGVFKDFVTNGNLTTTLGGYVTTGALDSAVEDAVDDATFTFASQSLKLSEIVYMLNQAVGTCNTVDVAGGRTQTTCSGGALGSMTVTRNKGEQ